MGYITPCQDEMRPTQTKILHRMVNEYAYLIIGFVGVTFLSGLQLKQGVYGQSVIENISSGNGSMISDNTNESLTEQVVDSKSLMLGIPDRAEENHTVGQMIDECGIIKPSSGMVDKASFKSVITLLLAARLILDRKISSSSNKSDSCAENSFPCSLTGKMARASQNRNTVGRE